MNLSDILRPLRPTPLRGLWLEANDPEPIASRTRPGAPYSPARQDPPSVTPTVTLDPAALLDAAKKLLNLPTKADRDRCSCHPHVALVPYHLDPRYEEWIHINRGCRDRNRTDLTWGVAIYPHEGK